MQINLDGNFRDCGAVDVSQVFTEDAQHYVISCQSTGNFPYLTYHIIVVEYLQHCTVQADLKFYTRS